jgi:hypothetical protein
LNKKNKIRNLGAPLYRFPECKMPNLITTNARTTPPQTYTTAPEIVGSLSKALITFLNGGCVVHLRRYVQPVRKDNHA